MSTNHAADTPESNYWPIHKQVDFTTLQPGWAKTFGISLIRVCVSPIRFKCEAWFGHTTDTFRQKTTNLL